MSFQTVFWDQGEVVMIDQTLLPHDEIYHRYQNPEDVAQAIEKMIVRGAPAIGVAAAFGLLAAANHLKTLPLAQAREKFELWISRFEKTRPTAVNLFWATAKMRENSNQEFSSTQAWCQSLHTLASKIYEDDIAACKNMGEHGASLIHPKARILTHCNAGALATAGWGTAVGVIRSAYLKGLVDHVWVDETRPFLQGARLTSWELKNEGIPATLITDNMAGYFMYRGEVDYVIVGADRIAANGDVANKIGTYSLAVLAKENDIPFFVAAPLSTIDRSCLSGKDIPIEERSPEEVNFFAGKRISPDGMLARHPAFDMTPNAYIRAIITEKGIAKPPFSENIPKLFTQNE